MTAKLSFCVKAATSLDDQDLATITQSIEHYQRAGMSAEQAESAAVGDMIAAVTAERGDMVKTLRTQHPDLFLSSRPPLPEPKKARARVQPIRGSMALGQISVQLDGLSPDLLPDLSSKVERTRVSKTGKRSQYTTWDNPPQPGVGPLFRKGGTADLSEVARVLEEEGYMEPGTIEADPIGATQRAQAIVKAELAKGGSTVRIGAPEEVEAEMQRRQDMANELPDDVFDGIDDDAFEQSGYADLPPEVKALTEQLLAQAEAAGLDTETMRERAAMGDPTDADYHAQLDALLTEALASAAAGPEEHDASAAPGGREGGREPAEGAQPGAGPAGRDAGRAEPGGLSYGGTVQEPGASYTTDLFGTDLEGAGATQLPTQRAAAPTPAPAPAPTATPTEGALNDTPAPEGNYQARTIVGSEIQRTLGAARITTPAEAAAATQYLYRNAVERLDGIVVDKNGKPLAVVGGFKGALAQASIYPSTLVGEAVRVPGAAAIWFSHNHPSGSAQLSNADKHLNQMLADVFRGSGIEPKGLLAIGDGRYHYVDEGGKEAAPWTITKLTTTSKVPAIERQLADSKEKPVELTSPLQAKAMAKKLYEAGGNRPGLLLTDAPQLHVVAWVPLPEVTHGKLRGTGGLKAIYRAVSEANAGAAFIVHGGELDGPVGTRANSSQNIAAALKAIDVRPIDSINVQTGKSAAETGERIDASTMLDLADNGTTDTPAFKAWFGDSKVVDAQGKPLVVYHGTHRDFSAFDAKAPSSHIPLPGFFFTPDPEIASMFAESGAKRTEDRAGRPYAPIGANVVPTYLSMQNPLEVDASAGAMKGFVSEKVIKEVILEAQRKGHDGVILRGWQDGSGPVQYIVFKPEQIKSATGNAGTFDPKNPDIRQDFQDTQQLERPEVTEGAPAQQDVDAIAKLEGNFKRKVEAFQSLKLTALPRRAAPGKNASQAERERYAAADLAEKLFGKRVVFFNSNIAFANGVMADYLPGMVFVNENTTRPIMAVLGHELTHSMRQSNPALYERLHDRLRGMLEEPGRYHEQLNRRREARGMDPLSYDKLREELLADIVGDNFTDPAFWRQMTAGQPTLFGRVLRVIRDFLDDLLAKLRNERPYGTNQYLNDVQGARDAVVEAMRAFGNDPKTAAAAVVTAAEADLSANNDPFYSELSRQVETAKMASAPAQGWKDWLKGLVNKGIIKADEVAWTGIEDFLDLTAARAPVPANGNAAATKDLADVAAAHAKVLADLGATQAADVQGDGRVKVPSDRAAAVDPVLVQRVAVDANSANDLRKLGAGRVKALGEVNVPLRRLMVAAVLGASHDREVLRRIVELVPVDVMHDLTGTQLSAKALLDDPAVLQHALTLDRDAQIPARVDAAITALLRVPTGHVAEMLKVSLELGRRLAAERAAVGTGEGRHAASVPSQAIRITRDQVVDFLAGNGVKVTETQSPTGESIGTQDFRTWQLPGGSNYREVLLTLPIRQDARDAHAAYLAQLRAKYPGTIAERMASYTPEERDKLNALEAARKKQDAPERTYQSGHWDQPNILAHIRLNDRTDADGKRVLFVEEIQSDWAQQGKKSGFKGDMIPQNRNWQAVDTLDTVRRREVAEERLPDLQKHLERWAKDDVESRLVIKERQGLDEDDAPTTYYDIIEEQRSAVESAPRLDGVPRAPFVGKTDAWVSLAIKRVIKMAVDEGYDRVAFVSGEQSAARYSLSKQVHSIKWEPYSNGATLVSVFVPNQNALQLAVDKAGKVESARGPGFAGMEGKGLDDIIGKEVAKRIMEAPKGELAGDGLNIGGEGMKAFYDQIVPKVAKDVVKKLGGQTGQVKIDQQGNNARVGMPDEAWPFEVWRNGRVINRHASREFAQEEVDEFRASDERTGRTDPTLRVEQVLDTSSQQTGFDITPSMREKAAGGLPMFSLQHTPEEEAALAKAGINTRTRLQRAGDRIRQHYTTAQNALRSDWAAGFQQGALDQFTGINRAIKREIGALPRDQDPYVAARLANGGTSSVMRGLMLHGQARWAANGQHLEKIPGTEGLLDILKPLGPRLNDFFGWMIGNRAERLMKEGRENNFTADDIKALKGLNKGMESEFRAAALKYAAFKRTVLDVAEQAGLLDPDGRKVWDNADYIPFYREIDEKAVFGATGKKGLAGQSSGIRTLKGGEAALNDPMENILMNFSRLVDASLKNRALRSTIDVLTAAKSDIVDKVGYDMAKQVVPANQVRKQLEAAGTPQQILDIIPPEAFEGMAKMWAIQAPTDPDVVRVMRNGKPEFYKVNDPLLLKALTSFVPFDFPGLGVARAFKRVLTGMVTVTPDFMLRNWIRDTAATAIITRDGFNPIKSLSGVVKSYREAGAFEDLLFAGASFQSGHINAADPVQTGKAMRRALREKGFDASSTSAFIGSILDTPMRFFEKYKHVGESIENGNREAVYEAARTAGKSPTAAAFESKDLMDFSLRGSSPFYQLLADVLPFFNARVQGLYRLGRADPKRVALYGTLMMVATLALAYANGDNDDYDKLPDWDKETYWHFWIKGEHFRMPKPFELGAVFASIPERIMRYTMGQDTGKKSMSRLWAIVRDQLAFDPVPQLIRPVMNTWANKDTFRDRPIENQGDEGKLPSMRYSKVTSPTAVAAVKAIAPVADEIGLSPKKLEYLVGGYLGTAGLYALGLSDMAVSKLRGDPVKPATRLDQLPIIGSFYRQEPATSTVYETDLYKMRTEVEQIYKSVRALKKDDKDDEAEALAAKHEKELDARKTLERGAKKLTSLNKQRDEIYADRTMTREEKRKAIDELLRDRAEISKDTMKSEEVINAQ